MIKKIKLKSPDPYLSKIVGDNTLARIAHVNQLVDQINANTVDSRPYKVYTALLTQSGGDAPVTINSGLLDIGVTYEIIYNSLGMDFTNVGAPNNEVGTKFVATGETPNSWGDDVGVEEILAWNEGAPVVKVLENTIGDIVWNYSSAGNYYGELSNAFTENKTFLIIGTSNDVSSAQVGVFEFYTDYISSNSDRVFLYSWDVAGVGLVSEDNILYNTSIEIRVYN